jgi:hypothetical protein
MVAPFQPSGPANVARPFVPQMMVTDPAERIAHALEHIAVSLAALDHNLEVLLNKLSRGNR